MSDKPKDLKEALSSGRKPDITHMRKSMLVYGSRACEYGSDKYERANFLRPTDGGLRADFERFRAYLRACVSHVNDTLDAMEFHQALDPKLEAEQGMRTAAYAADTDATPGSDVGASGLPHLCGAIASLNMAIEQATRAKLLPADPGQPWKGLCAGYKLPDEKWEMFTLKLGVTFEGSGSTKVDEKNADEFFEGASFPDAPVRPQGDAEFTSDVTTQFCHGCTPGCPQCKPAFFFDAIPVHVDSEDTAPIAGHPPIETDDGHDDDRTPGNKYSHDSENCVHRVPLSEHCDFCGV